MPFIFSVLELNIKTSFKLVLEKNLPVSSSLLFVVSFPLFFNSAVTLVSPFQYWTVVLHFLFSSLVFYFLPSVCEPPNSCLHFHHGISTRFPDRLSGILIAVECKCEISRVFEDCASAGTQVNMCIVCPMSKGQLKKRQRPVLGR